MNVCLPHCVAQRGRCELLMARFGPYFKPHSIGQGKISSIVMGHVGVGHSDGFGMTYEIYGVECG